MKKTRFKIGILLSFLLVLGLTGCKQTEEDSVLSDFKPPSDFEWEGSYMDADGTTTLVIEKKSGKKYSCTINVSDEEITHIDTYEFTAEEGEHGLSYEDGVHTTYNIPDYEENPDASVETSEVYTDGTGTIYYLDGNLYWLDNMNDAGDGYTFEKVEDTEETDSSESEETESTEETTEESTEESTKETTEETEE